MCKITQHQSIYITWGETQGISWSTLIKKFSAPLWKNRSLQTLEHYIIVTIQWKKAWWLLHSRKKERKSRKCTGTACMYWSMYTDIHLCTWTSAHTHTCAHTHTHISLHTNTHTHGKKHMHTNTDLYKPLVNSIVSQACFTLVVHKHARGLEKKKKSEWLQRYNVHSSVFIQNTQKSATVYPAYNHTAVALMQTLLLIMT